MSELPADIEMVLGLFEHRFSGRIWIIAYREGEYWYDSSGSMLDNFTLVRWQPLPSTED